MAKSNVAKWKAITDKMDGAVLRDRNPFSTIIQTPSPSMNFVFGNTWGVPLGYSAVLYGLPKAGKTVILNYTTAQIHKDYEDGHVVKFDTEMREEVQLTRDQMTEMGIDPDRYHTFAVNTPVQVFDRIEKDLAEMCQDGFPLKAVYIDSINGIIGRRMGNADSIDKVQIGDLAQTLQDGFKRILTLQRQHHFAVIVTSQVRAELDPVEQMRGNKYKMAAAFATKHWAEYFIFVEPLNNKDSKSDLLGNKLEDDKFTDLNDNADRTAQKVRVTCKDNSLGPKGRVGVFTLDYRRGIINVHEEVFQLGVNRNVIGRPNSRTYTFQEKSWNSKEAALEALKDQELAALVISECRAQDLSGKFAHLDAADAAALKRTDMDL